MTYNVHVKNASGRVVETIKDVREDRVPAVRAALRSAQRLGSSRYVVAEKS